MLGFSKIDKLFENKKEVINKLYNLSKKQYETFIKDGVLVNDLTFTNINQEELWVNHRSQAIYTNEGVLDHIEGRLINNTEIKQKETAVKKQLKERISKELAIAATEQKSKFLSIMTNNIRTPLTAIIEECEKCP
mgnify:CR=1 FL=1